MRRNSRTDSPVVEMRYSVAIIIYDKAGNVTDRDSKLFRLRRQAENYAKTLREQHNAKGIFSFIEVVKLDGAISISTFKSKNLKKAQGKKK